jgi:hypothetical protein
MSLLSSLVIMQDQYYTVMIPKQYPSESDLNRQKKLLELGNPNLFGGGSYSKSSSRVASAATIPVKLKSAAVQVDKNSSDIQTQRQLLALGSVNYLAAVAVQQPNY